jgi:hypothetical protein
VVEVQTPIDDSLFLPRYQEAPLFPLVLVGAPRKGQAPGSVTPWIVLEPSPHVSGFQPNHHGPSSLCYKVAATPQMQLVWSRKTTSPSDVQQWCNNSLNMFHNSPTLQLADLGGCGGYI